MKKVREGKGYYNGRKKHNEMYQNDQGRVNDCENGRPSESTKQLIRN